MNWLNSLGTFETIIYILAFHFIFFGFAYLCFKQEDKIVMARKINKAKKKIKADSIGRASRSDFAKQDWANLARQRDLPRFQNDTIFADKIVRDIEKTIKKRTS